MTANSTKPAIGFAKEQHFLCDDWFDPLETGVRGFIEELPEAELAAVLPNAETAGMPFWALLVLGQIAMRKVDGWPSLSEKPSDQSFDLAA